MPLACVLRHHISSGRYTTEEQEDIYKKENSALSEHTCLTNHVIGWDNSKIITTYRRYHRTSAFVWKPGILIPPTFL